jgi:hypothetical protein
VGRALAQPAAASYLVEYEVAAFADAEGWLLLMDDDVAGRSDWQDGVLTYDFRQGAAYLGIDNRLDPLRGAPDAVILLLESDGGGQQLAIRLRDSMGQYFQATIAQLDQPGTLRAERSLHDIGGPSWQVFGGAADRIARPPLMVTSIIMDAGPGRLYGAVRLRGIRARTLLRQEEGLRVHATPKLPIEHWPCWPLRWVMGALPAPYRRRQGCSRCALADPTRGRPCWPCGRLSRLPASL